MPSGWQDREAGALSAILHRSGYLSEHAASAWGQNENLPDLHAKNVDSNASANMTTNLEKYQRIAPFYDLLDLPFEYRRYRRIRPLLFKGLSGHLLDAGVGTGRNFPFYPRGSSVVGIDLSPAMLARASRRAGLSPGPVVLRQMDVTKLDFPNASFDAAVATFLFCVLPDELQLMALRELGRVVKPGGLIRLLEYVRPRGTIRRLVARLWEPWIKWAYGAGFDRHTEQYIPAAGLQLVDSMFVWDDLIKLISVRVPGTQ